MDTTPALCMNCFNSIPDGCKNCPQCDFPRDGQNPQGFLPIGTHLSERYTVGRMTHYSGAAAHYVGYDRTSRSPVTIEEFMPERICERDERGTLTVTEEFSAPYALLHEQFRRTARAVARLRDLHIILPIYDIFEQNNTTYTVGEYTDDKTLTKFLNEKGGRLSWEETRRLFIPFLSSLVSCHASGLLHLGICPDNLLVGADGKLRLTGFEIPAIRAAGSALTPQLVTGYAAPEQYERAELTSAATDVYGVTATLFRVLSGNTPPDGAHRDPEENDLLLAADVAQTLPPYLALTLADGLKINSRLRIPTVLELRDRLSTGEVVDALSQDTVSTPKIKDKKKDEPKKPVRPGTIALIALCAVAILASVIAVAVTLNGAPKSKETGGQTAATTTTTAVTSEESSASSLPSSAVPNLCGGNYDYYGLTVQDGKRQSGPFTVELEALRFDDTVPYGMILSQSPEAGTMLEEGGVIKVIISAGKQVTTVPNVTGWEAEHAKLYLEALGFRVTVSEEANTSVPVGHVIGTWPKGGQAPEPGAGNKVTLRVNNYEKPTTTTQSQPTEAPNDVSGVVTLSE